MPGAAGSGRWSDDMVLTSKRSQLLVGASLQLQNLPGSVLGRHAQGPVCEELSPTSTPLIATYRVTVIDLAFGVLDHHHQLGLKGDDQHWALLHYLAQGQLQETQKYGPQNCVPLPCTHNPGDEKPQSWHSVGKTSVTLPC